jgi:hypothetical protein
MDALSKCSVGPCPRRFIPGKTGANGRCSRCEMRRRRGQPEITVTEAHLTESKAAGEVGPRTARFVGYIREDLAEIIRQEIAAGRYTSESQAVNVALALLVERGDLA